MNQRIKIERFTFIKLITKLETKKMKKLLFILSISILFSCASPSYFQLYKTVSEDVKAKDNGLIFENDDVLIAYNLWKEGGASSFLFYNKTDSNLYVDKQNTHLIINNFAKTYFQNRVFSESSATSAAVENINSEKYLTSGTNTFASTLITSGMVSSSVHSRSTSSESRSSTTKKTAVSFGHSVAYEEADIICIPPHSSKHFNGFALNNNLYRSCELMHYPKKKNEAAAKFTEDNTPIDIRIVIAYGSNKSQTSGFKSINNHFWVKEIINYTYFDFLERVYPEYCGKKSQHSKMYYIYDKPDRFYIQYKR